jgi:hypothetical protein
MLDMSTVWSRAQNTSTITYTYCSILHSNAQCLHNNTQCLHAYIPARALISKPPGAPPCELPLLELEVTPLDLLFEVAVLAFSCAFFNESTVVALSGSNSTAYICMIV